MKISVSGIYNNLVKIQGWNVGVIAQPISDFLRPNNNPKIVWLPTPDKRKYLADPFGVIRDHRIFIMCEEFDYSTGKGRIVCFEEGEDHSFGASHVAMELPIHISYPYLLEWKGETYCIPETGQAREVSLYRAQEFPYRWEKAATLIANFPGLDASIFGFEGRWWLTCTNLEDGEWEKLFIWHADDLTGPWRPHSANPVKISRRSSRPAGTPFMHEGTLYRPAQDCSNRYGQNVVINRIIRLTTEKFEEEEVTCVKPFQPYLEGLHTLSSIDGLTLIDGRRSRIVDSFSEIRYNITGQWRHLLQRLPGLQR
ncbi:MAG: hypothetical protein ABSF63_06540 [Candidatus Bathyarchaeia archaeon]|jgi:hypothetical protein